MDTAPLPEWLDVSPWLPAARPVTPAAAAAAMEAADPGPRELAALLAPAAAGLLEPLARRAQTLTRRHFGRTISLYTPLYLSNYCSGGCAYCGYAADRHIPRRRLSPAEVEAELSALERMGVEEVLLLTGERIRPEDFQYVRDCVACAAGHAAMVTVETFPMGTAEYASLVAAGCTGVTIYQETYDPEVYDRMHRWGPKKDYRNRLEAPARALEAGMRTVGLGVLLGLADPVTDALRLYRHAVELQKRYWAAGVSISFPRLRPEAGGFHAPHAVDDTLLARLILAFRLLLPEVHLVLSTRESAPFRDGMAGLGISKMSAGSRTTVGGYSAPTTAVVGQFEVCDPRSVEEFCAALRAKGLEPVFKNWDAVYRAS